LTDATSRDEKGLGVGELGPLLGFLFAAAATVGLPLALLARLQDERGLPTESLGLIAATAFLVAPLVQFGLVRHADQGRSRQLLAGGTLAVAIGALGFAWTDQVWILTLSRAATGAGFGAISPTIRGMLTRAEPERSGQLLGWTAAAELAGFIGGPAAGAVIATHTSTPLPFVGGAVLVSCAGLLVLRVLPRHLNSVPAGFPVDAPGLGSAAPPDPLSILRRRPVAGAALLLVSLSCTAGLYEAIWARYMEDLGASTQFVGLSLAMYGVPFAVVSPIAGRLADRGDPRRMALMATAVVVPITALNGQVGRPWLLMSVAMFEAMANGAGIPAAQLAMARACGPHEQTTGQGIAAGLGQLSAGAMALVAAPVYAAEGPGTLFALGAIVVIVLAFGAGLVTRPPAPRPAL